MEVMKMIHKILTFEMPPEFGGLVEESGGHYFKAKLQTIPFLKREVIEPVESAVKEQTGWNDDNIPDREHEQEIKIGSTVFQVTTKPTTKRPGYKEVYEHTLQFLDTLTQQHRDGIERKGVVTRDDQLYVGVDHLLDAVNRYKNQVLRRGVSQGIDVELKKAEDKISVPIMDYGQLPRQAGEMYQHAKPFHTQADQRAVKALEAALKEDTGFNQGKVPSDPQHSWKQLGEYLFHLISSPTTNIKYGKIVNGLIKETKKQGKTTGELVSLDRGWALPEGVQYDTYSHAGKTFVGIASLEGRIGDLVNNHSTPDVRHTLNSYPLSW